MLSERHNIKYKIWHKSNCIDNRVELGSQVAKTAAAIQSENQGVIVLMPGHIADTLSAQHALRSLQSLQSNMEHSLYHCWAVVKIVITDSVFSSESDSRFGNVRPSVCLSVSLSVCHRNPSASQNCSYWPPSLSTIKPIDHPANRPSSQSTIKPMNHQAN